VVGYGALVAAHNNTAIIIPYAMQNTFTLLAPTLFAATIYMMFGRLATVMCAENHSIVRVSLLTKLFVGGDVFAFVFQGGAAGMLMIQDLASIGKSMVILGLVIQILSFGLFMVTSAIFHKRVVNDLTLKTFSADINWPRIIKLLYAISMMIMIRSIFRLIEYVQGMEGYCMSHEWTLYIFDSVPMVLSSALLIVYFPSTLQQTLR
jgi:hypothetical protein